MNLNLQKTLYTLTSRASYWKFIVRIWEKIGYAKTAQHCTLNKHL